MCEIGVSMSTVTFSCTVVGFHESHMQYEGYIEDITWLYVYEWLTSTLSSHVIFTFKKYKTFSVLIYSFTI